MNPELDLSQLLTQLSSNQSTGCLQVVYGSTKWNVFLRFGQLITADCSVQSLDHLRRRLQQLGYTAAAQAVKTNPHDGASLLSDSLVHQEIDYLALQGFLNQEQMYCISSEFTKEAFESLLWLNEKQITWQPNQIRQTAFATHSLPNLNLLALLDYYQQRLSIWQKVSGFIRSPHQQPYLANERFLEQPLPEAVLSPVSLNQIAQLMNGISLRDLALLLKQDELKLAQLLFPYIRHHIIGLKAAVAPFHALPLLPSEVLPFTKPHEELNPSAQFLSRSSHKFNTEGLTTIPQQLDTSGNLTPIERFLSNTKTYQIACIDDSPLILDEIERFLGNKKKYQLTKLDEPIKASTTIFRLKPDLILMDITMPNINGYKLCSLFRNSEALAHTPIIMVTGNKGLIDKARAKLVGATDYLTKPFSEHDLLAIVSKYLD